MPMIRTETFCAPTVGAAHVRMLAIADSNTANSFDRTATLGLLICSVVCNEFTTCSSSGSSSIRHDAEVIGLVGLAHGTSHFFHLMLPPLFPWLMKDFDLRLPRPAY